MATTLATTSRMMRAVVKTGPGEEGVILDHVPVPDVPDGYAKVEVAGTGICGTDIHIAHDEYANEPPVVMGHEITGTVLEVGDEADASLIGDRVACETYFSTCGVCAACRDGRANLCQSRRSVGSYEHGGFAEFVVVPVKNLHRLPEGLGDVDGALAEPLACVAQCLMNPAVVQAGDRVLVTGPGAMGQLAAQVARAHGGRVTLSGLPQDADRLAVAGRLGIAVTTGGPDEAAFDVVIECSGSAGGAGVALRAARRGGRYVQVGIFGRPVQVDLDLVLYKELVVSSGFASTAASWRAAMRLIETGAVRLGPLVSQVLPLERFADAFDSAKRGEGLKTVVSPHSEVLVP